jgi:hypothetical protein
VTGFCKQNTEVVLLMAHTGMHKYLAHFLCQHLAQELRHAGEARRRVRTKGSTQEKMASVIAQEEENWAGACMRS